MSGIRNGAQALFKREGPRALYVHCLTHSLNLCVQDVSKICKLIGNTLNFIHDLVQLIKFSPKQLTLFETLKSDVTLSTGQSAILKNSISNSLDCKEYSNVECFKELQNTNVCIR